MFRSVTVSLQAFALLALMVRPSLADRGLEPASKLDFVRDVRPLLSQYCFACHGPDEAAREADLRLDDIAHAREVLAGYDSPLESPIGERLASRDSDLQMPPAGAKQPTAKERELLLAWLAGGATLRKHWSFEAVRRPDVPTSSPELAGWVQNPIDAFVAAKFDEQGLTPSPRADAETLRRRLAITLNGLPPRDIGKSHSTEHLAEYVNRLINSPRYGEHMAYSWLEAARYADTDGYQNDRYRYQSAWRDWVIRAYSTHMPYDQFITEQLAGDLLPAATLWQQVATGFGRNHRINSEDGSIEAEWRVENVVDRVDTLGTVFLGLTVSCARCHDHKYDPISQVEYYQLFAYFNNLAEYGIGPNNGNTPPFVELPKSWPSVAEDEDKLITPEPVKLRAARKDAGNGLRRPQAGEPGTVMVMHELAKPRDTYLLNRGQYDAPDKSKKLSPGVPQAINLGGEPPKDRLELAKWLVDPRNPLTARVAVNRIWQQFFGRGLVQSSDNLGSQGSVPSHPELLDWLAAELIESGWSIQHIQRLIAGSATFAQSSTSKHASAPGQTIVDSENVWLSRGPRVRFSAPIVRDAALATSGLLVERLGGPSVKPYMPPKVWSSMSNNKYVQDKGGSLFRRSLYTYWRRTIPPPTMVAFNAAGREVCSVNKEVTNTPLQALTLLNNKMFVEAARNLAQRSMRKHNEPVDQIAFAFRQVLSREPDGQELKLLIDTFEQAQQHFESDAKAARGLLGIGESHVDESLSTTQSAAMTVVANLIYNLDEAIYRE